MGKLIYDKIPVIKIEAEDICFEPRSLKKYRSALEEGYDLKEDIRGKMLGNLYLEQIISVSGSYGIVVKAYDVIDKKYYAVKLIRPKPENEESEYYEKVLVSEVEAFNVLSRYPNCEKNITCLYKEGVIKESKKISKKVLKAIREDPNIPDKDIQPVKEEYVYLQMELMSGDLTDFIYGMIDYQGDNWGKKYPEIVKKIILSIMKGLDVIHDAGLAHMDLKPDNILVKFGGSVSSIERNVEACDFYKNPKASNLTVKIGDLGFICSGKRGRGGIQNCWTLGTPTHVSPEIIASSNEDKFSLPLARKSDIWSLGIILGELLFPRKYIEKLTRANGVFWKKVRDKDGGNFDKNFERFLRSYKTFLSKLPKYRSGNEEFDKDMTIIFHRMINIDPNKRDGIKDLIVMLPPLRIR